MAGPGPEHGKNQEETGSQYDEHPCAPMEAARLRLAATAAGCLTGEAGRDVDVGGAGRDVDAGGVVWVLTNKAGQPTSSTGTAVARLPSVPTASPSSSPSSCTFDALTPESVAREDHEDPYCCQVEKVGPAGLKPAWITTGASSACRER